MKIVWRDRAARPLRNQITYIGERSPHGAERARKRVAHAIELLLLFPEIGRETRRKGVR